MLLCQGPPLNTKKGRKEGTFAFIFSSTTDRIICLEEKQVNQIFAGKNKWDVRGVARSTRSVLTLSGHSEGSVPELAGFVPKDESPLTFVLFRKPRA